jgi:hypothetical protein
MAEATNELMYELLKRMNSELALIREDVRGGRDEMTAMPGHMLAIQRDVNNIYERMGSLKTRVERIGRRLNIVDAE